MLQTKENTTLMKKSCHLFLWIDVESEIFLTRFFSHGAIAPLKKGLRLIKSVIKTINYLICVLEVLKLELLY